MDRPDRSWPPLVIVLALVASLSVAVVAGVRLLHEEPLIGVVVGDAASPDAFDLALRELIDDAGLRGQFVDDDEIAATPGLSAVFLSRSAAPALVRRDLARSPLAVVATSRAQFEQLSMVRSPPEAVELIPRSSVEIVDPAYALAAGRSGAVEATTSPAKLVVGRPAPSARIIATAGDDLSLSTLFSYEPGDALVDSAPAPARRVGLFLGTDVPPVLTDDGRALVSAALRWAASGSEDNAPPIVEAGRDQVLEPNQGALVVGLVSDDRNDASLEWTVASGAAVTEPRASSTTVSFPGPGAYVVTLTADDGEFVTSDSLTVLVRPASVRTKVLVIAGATDLPVSDRPIVERLEALGHEVRVLNDNVVAAHHANGVGLIIVAPSVAPNVLSPEIAQLGVPTIIWDEEVLPRFGMIADIGAISRQVAPRRTTIAADHPITAGYGGAVVVRQQRRVVAAVAPAGSGVVLATREGVPGASSLFVFDAGAELAAGVAPNRRVAFLLGQPSDLAEQGWALFERAITWSMSPVDNVAPTVEAGRSQTLVDRTVGTMTAAVFDDGLPNPPSAVVVKWRGPAGVQFSSPDTLATDVTFPGVGRYQLALSANDGEFSAEDTVEIIVRRSTSAAVQWRGVAGGSEGLPAPPTEAPAVDSTPPGDASRGADPPGDEEAPVLDVPTSATGDFDGDGDTDFIIAVERGEHTEFVLYDRVNVGWVPWTIADISGAVARTSAVVDVDRDGDLDVVLAGGDDALGVLWLANPGEARRWSPAVITEASELGYADVAAGDLDGDGIPEIVAWRGLRSGGAELVVIRRTLDTTWSVEVAHRSAGAGAGVAIADIADDGDQRLDIVAGNSWFAQVEGAGWEQSFVDESAAPGRLAVGQLIPGGRPEIVFDTGVGVGPLRWYEADGSQWTSHELEATSEFGTVALADFDGDGLIDILAGEMSDPFPTPGLENPDARTVMFANRGDGEFAVEAIAEGIGTEQLSVADFDDDGDLDALARPSRSIDGRVHVWMNDSQPMWRAWNRDLVDEQAPYRAILVDGVDVDGDRDVDIVAGGSWYENLGDAVGWSRRVVGADFGTVMLVDDVDGDGDVDLIGTRMQDPPRLKVLVEPGPHRTIVWAQNNGAGAFQIHEVAQASAGLFPQGAAIAQLEPGGPRELIVSWKWRLGLWQRTGDTGAPGLMAFTIPADPTQPWSERTLSSHSEGEQIVVDDLDGDGDVDVLTGLQWLRNDGGSRWTIHQISPRVGSEVADRVSLADVDGDGDDDIVIGFGNRSPGQIAWFERDGDPTQPWTRHLLAHMVQPLSLDVGDMDGDGDNDVIAGEFADDGFEQLQLLAFENIDASSGDWAAHALYVGDEHNSGTQLVDVDADGVLDIISIGFTHRRIAVYSRSAR